MRIDARTALGTLRSSSIFRIGLGFLLGVAFLALVVQNVDFSVVYRLMASATLMPLAVALLAFVADFLLRAVRFWWMLLLATHRPLPLRPMIGPFIASFGMNDLLPLRVGDGFRAIWFSKGFDLPLGSVVGAMLVERILDLVTIVILGAIALAFLDDNAPAALVGNFQMILGVAAAAGCGLLFAPALVCHILEKLFARFDLAPVTALIGVLRASSSAVLQLGSWYRLASLALMSLLLWLLESIVLVGAWISLGETMEALQKPLVAFVFSTLGTLVPSLPGHFGSFEYFGMQAFSLTGVNASTSAAVLLLAHLILWAPTAIFGVFWLLFGVPRSLRKPA